MYFKHGLSKSPEYKSWSKMLERCDDRTGHHSHHYAARGITVCAKWRSSFSAFLEDVGPIPTRGYTIERIDNDRGYEPGNVRWATRSEQARNRTSSHMLTVDGVTATLAEWSERTGIDSPTIRARVNKLGWSHKDAVTIPVNSYQRRVS
jgi:hypothetical protein